MQSPEELFAPQDDLIKDILDPEDVVNIDIESIDELSDKDAVDMIENLSKLYFDEAFLKNQPNFKKRVDSELESLRINIKMRKADEIAHDILLKNIGQNPSNASMYRSLTELQKTILSITTKIEDTITRLTNMMKSYQMEINFDENSDDNENEDNQPSNQNIYKGSKAFIEAMSDEDD